MMGNLPDPRKKKDNQINKLKTKSEIIIHKEFRKPRLFRFFLRCKAHPDVG